MPLKKGVKSAQLTEKKSFEIAKRAIVFWRIDFHGHQRRQTYFYSLSYCHFSWDVKSNTTATNHNILFNKLNYAKVSSHISSYFIDLSNKEEFEMLLCHHFQYTDNCSNITEHSNCSKFQLGWHYLQHYLFRIRVALYQTRAAMNRAHLEA